MLFRSLTELAKKSGVDPNKTIEALREKRKRYPTSQGWEPFEVVGFERDSSKKIKFDESGLPELKIKEQPYQFHQKLEKEGRIAEGQWDQGHVDDLANKLVKEVMDVANRADTGDKNAGVIMTARNWYRAMRDRLRQEYGGFADTMADILGTTSAQTGEIGRAHV